MEQHLNIFKSLFKGREDVFAIRWEREGKTGYMPAYVLNWDEFKAHKVTGGTLKDFKNKVYAPLSNERIINHLNGKEVLGIYPLLTDNTCWFIAADFDQSSTKSKKWIDECLAFMKECRKYHLPVYLERSRSGNGGHVWLFFEEQYPAHKSRKLFIHLLNTAGITSGIKNDSNFDRLFPNQDEHSGKGLGNLIALPLQQNALQNFNTCFINTTNLEPFPDQWAFLLTIQKIGTENLNELYKVIINNNENEEIKSENNQLQIVLNSQVSLSRDGLSNLLLRYLRDNLNFMNVDYLIKKNSGRSTYATEAYFKTIVEKDDQIIIPRGIIGKLLRYCKEQNISYHLEDRRVKTEFIVFHSSISLYDYQQTAIEATLKKDFGVIVAPPGSGKTIIGLAIIALKKQRALIIVHRKQLFDQWVTKIESFLGIPKFRIGKIEGGKFEVGEEITVAMIQSLQALKLTDEDKLFQSFGTILVDECHHIPAKTFREVIRHFNSCYLYGFTATPVRKNKDEKLIFIYIGDIINEIIIPVTGNFSKPLSITIGDTELSISFNATTDKIETLINILIYDTARNELIANDIKREVKAGRKILVLTERKAHVEILQQYLKDFCETIVLTGDDKEQNRKSKLQMIEEGDFQVLIATGQFIGEGTDIGILNCLVLAYPFAFEGKLIQYIGRVQRSNAAPVIYDYRDYKIEYFDKLFKQRNRYYRKLFKAGQLTKFDEPVLVFNGGDFNINASENTLSIDCLDLPLPVERFKDDIAWKLRVINFNEEEGELFTEIIDYNFATSKVSNNLKTFMYLDGIEKIRFRNIDTSGFLKSVILKKQTFAEVNVPTVPFEKEKPVEHVLLKIMKVPFQKIKFLHAAVSFPIFIEAVNQEIVFEIANTDIRPEFEAIRDYFSKALKKKLITTDITIRYTENKILFATARSEDIDSINDHMIDGVRFEFVKREFVKGKAGTTAENALHTIEGLLSPYKEAAKLFSSETSLLDELLNIQKSKHYLQLKYLSSRHVASVLKLRFVLQPFSFLFLLSGEKKYHIVWETLDTEEATYVWHTNKSREALQTLIAEIEIIISDIKKTGRQHFLQKDLTAFSRIVHDYSDANKGFVTWKGLLEEVLI